MIRVIDNILPVELYETVMSDISFFTSPFVNEFDIAKDINSYHDAHSHKLSSYMFWPGWWQDNERTLHHRVIRGIWEHNLPFHIDEICGFEYWTRTFAPGQYINEHVDEDTFEYRDSKIFYGPKYGCVWYGVDNEDGGFLEIHKNSIIDGTKNALEQNQIIKYKSEILDRERFRYKGNRAIMFDSGHILHNTTPAPSGVRQVLVINIWTRDKEPKALQTGEFVYE